MFLPSMFKSGGQQKLSGVKKLEETNIWIYPIKHTTQMKVYHKADSHARARCSVKGIVGGRGTAATASPNSLEFSAG